MDLSNEEAEREAVRQTLVGICNDRNCGTGRPVASNLQHVHTPYGLCYRMIEKLERNTTIFDKDFLVFNLEFVEVLLYDFKVARERVWFATDCQEKAKLLEHPRYKGTHAIVMEEVEDMGRQFDVVIMNPPYQKPSDKTDEIKGGASLWPSFVEKSLSLCKSDGFCVHIHPSGWRKPGNKLWPVLSKKKIKYLEIHGPNDGKKTFGADTFYDWYVLQNSRPDAGSSLNWETVVVDEQGVQHEFDLSKMPCLPNWNFDEFRRILARKKEDALNVVFSHSVHDARQPWMAKRETQEFKYPCVHAAHQGSEVLCYYSNKKSELFVPKVILTESLYLYPLIDMKGEYGMCQHCFGITADTPEYAERVKKAIESVRFKEIVKATKWGNYGTDHRMFEYFRKDFWRAFIDEKGNEIPAPKNGKK